MKLQLFAAASGVYPCYENQFQIDTSESGASAMKSIADCVTFGTSIDNGVEEWTPFETEGSGWNYHQTSEGSYQRY